MIRSCAFSLRVPLELMDKLVDAVKEDKHADISKAMRSYIEIGMLVESYKPKIKDPEFLKTIEELKQNDSIFDWTKSLTDAQLDAIVTALGIEKEKRFGKKT